MLLKSLNKRVSQENDSSSEDIDLEENDSNTSDKECNKNSQRTGWADAIAKVLSTTKPKNKKTLVLSRAKKCLANVQDEKQDCGFEVDGALEEKPIPTKLEEGPHREVKNQKLDIRVKPSWQDIERERALRKIATKGVVQLFNAVRMQQKDLDHKLKEAGPLDSRKEAVLNNINKRKFLDILMSGKRAKSEIVDGPIKDEVEKHEEASTDEENGNRRKKIGWSVLRDDFMTNKKNKHWDQDDSDVDSALSDEANENESDD